MNKKEIGNLGEKIASNFLQKKGYKILERNYFSKITSGPQKGEIDIIAQKESIIHFIEVKTFFKEKPFFSPEQNVNREKINKIIKTAENWLMKNKIPLDNPWQVDALAITIFPEHKKAKIRYFKNVL